MSAAVWIGLAIVVGLPILFVVVQYNKLVGLRWRVRESWANVDTELKRRHDLIPNLVATVQGYAAHERGLFQEVTRLRAEAVGAPGDSAERRSAEQGLALALGRLFAVAEAYPSLKASENFLQLQRELVTTEDRIQAARRFFNGNVRDLNNQVGMFPSNLVARMFGFAEHEYFELPNAVERQAPPVAMS